MGQNRSTAVMQRRHVALDKLDYFPTPPWAMRAFLHEVLHADRSPLGNVWEPACGEGRMVNVLRECAVQVRGSDVHDYGQGFDVGSFTGKGLDVISPWPECDWVITNPPFNLALGFALRALAEARVGVALLLRSAWLEGGERYTSLFKPHPPSLVVQYCDRVPMVAGKYDPGAASATCYSWVVWMRSVLGPTVLRWIEPGARARNFRDDDVRRWAGKGLFFGEAVA